MASVRLKNLWGLSKGGKIMDKWDIELEPKPFANPVITDDTVTIRRAAVSYCQSCAKAFKNLELVYWVHLDGNTVCSACSDIHRDKQLRICVRAG
jgi:hypothetical protein